jgi:hypothetical protein
MRWFLIAGCVGVMVAAGLTAARNHVPSNLILMLWPSSILGMLNTEPSEKMSVDLFLVLLIMYGGNFLLYGAVGGAAKYLARRLSDT